jgi:hypothetical protein
VKPLITYAVRYEIGLLAISSVLGGLFYFAYGLVPAIRMFAGCLIAAHLGLAWVFRASILEALRGLLSR